VIGRTCLWWSDCLWP